MDHLRTDIRVAAEVGFLDFAPEYLDTLVCKDPIARHYKVEHTPFARGKFASVRRVQCLLTGEYFAAKVVRKRRRAKDVRFEILHEAAVLTLAKGNPKIVRLHKVFETASDMTLILELAAGGELQRVIDEEDRIEEEAVRKYLCDLLTALRFLHTHSIAHLDLKPQNLLLTDNHPATELKLCDFGISRLIQSHIEVREVVGTPDYVAPEILQYEPISLATDMWSLGVLSYVLLTGHSPFGGDTKQETFLNISQGQLDFPEDLFEGVSSEAKHFISKLLIVEPGLRLTVDEALSHPWLAPSMSPCVDSVFIYQDEKRTTDIQHFTTSLKRGNSPSMTIASNKENDRNLLNGFSNEEVGHNGSSPPSKRECKEAAKKACYKSTIELTFSTASFPATVCSGSKALEEAVSSSEDPERVSLSCEVPVSSSLKEKFETETKISAMSSFRRGNLNKSFGSVDQSYSKATLRPMGLRRDDPKIKEVATLSPMGLRRDDPKRNDGTTLSPMGLRRDDPKRKEGATASTMGLRSWDGVTLSPMFLRRVEVKSHLGLSPRDKKLRRDLKDAKSRLNNFYAK